MRYDMRGRMLVSWLCLVTAAQVLRGEAVEVEVDPSCVRSIGGVSTFRRTQFITIHETPYSNDLTDADLEFLEKELEVSYGRDGGSRSWNMKRTKADPERPRAREVAQARRADRGQGADCPR